MNGEDRVRIILARQLKRRTPIACCALVNGFQAQFVGYPEEGIRLRSTREAFSVGDWQGKLVRTWTLRGTLHVVAESDLPLFLHHGRAGSERDVDSERGDSELSADRKKRFIHALVEALRETPLSREEMKHVCRLEGMNREEERSVFNPWGGLIRYLCDAGKIAQGYGADAPYRLIPSFEPMDRDAAETELLWRYIRGYGPVSIRDCRYFFKRPLRDIQTVIRKLDVRSDTVDGEELFFLDEKEPDGILPEAALLTGFDPLLMGYEKTRSPFLPVRHIRDVFTLTGIVRPTVLYRERIIGTWQGKGGQKTIRFFDDVPEKTRERASTLLMAQPIV